MAFKITDEQNYQDIADAIRGKLGGSDTFLPSEMASAIESIPTGGGGTSEFKTKFIDYDGTVLYEYTQEEVDALTELPPLPSHEGLIAQEWNWSLSDIKALGRQVIVGANYTTDNGRTRLYVSIPDYDRTVLCEFETENANGIRVYWGDGTTFDSSSRTVSTSHTYAEAGDYVVEFEVLTGKLILIGNINYGCKLFWSGTEISSGTLGASMYIKKVEIGNNVSLNSYAFRKVGAESISIPNDITHVRNSYGEMSVNPWLKCIVFPKGTTEIASQTANENRNLIYVSVPNGIDKIGSLAFSENRQLKNFTFPDSITEINSKAFYYCNHLENVALPSTEILFGSSVFYYATGFNDPEFLSTIHDVTSDCFYGIDIKKIIIDDNLLELESGALCSLGEVEEFIMRTVPHEMAVDAIGNLSSVKKVVLPSDLTVLCARMFFTTIR